MYHHFCIDEEQRTGGVLELEHRLAAYTHSISEPTVVQYMCFLTHVHFHANAHSSHYPRRTTPALRSATAPMPWRQTPTCNLRSHDVGAGFIRGPIASHVRRCLRRQNA